MHRSELPIRFPCPDPVKQLSSTPGRLYCASCDREVIELDRLAEREVRALQARARSGERICVRYRVDEEGLIQLRSAPSRSRPLAAAAVATVLACGTASADATLPRAPTPRTAPAGNKAAPAGNKTAPAPEGNRAAPVHKLPPYRAEKPVPAPPAPSKPAPPKPAPRTLDIIDGGI